ncbi:hypothetical protein PROFUN_01372 [Planoprotostelium fungivorum]|uniref:Uncharacterized protein n=1 Tax=Planoprotostelium fungivorum TaxID=1890364 RepID=A0A2P6NT55_9EUKA|nr:hypothetical protein PROFUN_01372 [Planoprotostelium fungivorum]
MPRTSSKPVNDSDRVRILVLGDSGVGKTSLVHLVCHESVNERPPQTIGVNVELMIHEYNDKPYIIEFFDVGGSARYEMSRSTFYQNINGVFCSTIPSLNSFRWKAEYLNKTTGHESRTIKEPTSPIQDVFGRTVAPNNITEDMLELELSSGVIIPMMMIGNKEDIQEEKMKQRSGMEESGSMIAHVSCHSSQAFAAGTSGYYALVSFLDKVIQRKFYSSGQYGRTSTPQRYGGYPSPTPSAHNEYTRRYSREIPLEITIQDLKNELDAIYSRFDLHTGTPWSSYLWPQKRRRAQLCKERGRGDREEWYRSKYQRTCAGDRRDRSGKIFVLVFFGRWAIINFGVIISAQRKHHRGDKPREEQTPKLRSATQDGLSLFQMRWQHISKNRQWTQDYKSNEMTRHTQKIKFDSSIPLRDGPTKPLRRESPTEKPPCTVSVRTITFNYGTGRMRKEIL